MMESKALPALAPLTSCRFLAHRYALRYAAFCIARFLAHRYAMLFVSLAS